MADKLIRDELLRSHRYQSLHGDTTKLLFIHLLLASDSLSNAEATTTAISLLLARVFTDESVAIMLTELVDHDLVRTYVVDGKTYVHIPRSRQRIRYLSGKHPRPPENIEDKEIKDLISKVGLRSDRGQVTVRPFSPDVAVAVTGVVTEKRVGRPRKINGEDKGSRLPRDWVLPDAWRDWAVNIHHLEPDKVIRISLKFRDYWWAKAGKDAAKRDWEATWHNWIRTEVGDA